MTGRFKSRSNTSTGFTLIELLMCIGILLLLAGIVFAGMGPAREKARETRCLSNLRQIGAAMLMYRQDYGGDEPPEATTCKQLGLPCNRLLNFALTPYIPNGEVWKCQSEYSQDGILSAPKISSYIITAMSEEGLPPQIVPFSKHVAERGEDTPIVADGFHSAFYRPVPQPTTCPVLVLRLNGQVQRLQVPSKLPTWKW